ncbi:hypothetical protein PV08_01338 [Exophiala spinifera]|uniref:FAD-binding domain-containing protein n=1 Tax=Exophiala spinifera TaxID=91928 RepID=A0A0D2BQK4_9EURO|nr:uncharacterized protein PV08_01338 [Exophiala spinifera]KIW20760.1 hypothetical protein PV08_01338 [Exophiala spinifera]
MPIRQPRLAIVGGGPAGLTVGILLHKHQIPFTIFEYRPKPTDDELESPVGMLDLHEESGLAALKECALLEGFESHTAVCSEAQIIANKEGDIIYKDDGGPEARPEISRNSLTKLLLDQLPAGSIHWEHKLSSASYLAGDSDNVEIELNFGRHGKHTFDFVVGADGTWSRVRTLLTSAKPRYAGLQYMMLAIRHVSERYPTISEYVGTGSFVSLGKRNGIMCQRALQDSALIYAFLSVDNEHFAEDSGLTKGTPAEASERLLNDEGLFGQFGPKLKELLQTACEEETRLDPNAKLVVRSLYTLPHGHSWEHRTGVTLVGDASHVMLPFAGEGVNVAMWDALDVSRSIIKAYESSATSAVAFQAALDPLVKEFEVNMAARAKEKADEASNNAKLMLGSEDGATAMADWMRAAMQQAKATRPSVE